MQIESRKVVTLEYTLTDEGGDVLDTSKGGEPLVYLHGSGHIIPGLENALAGKAEGESLKVTVAPADAYGDRDEELLQTVPKSRLGDEELDVGMQFQARGPEGPVLLTVVGVLEDTVTLDANHPLAGKTLTFDVTVIAVRDATLEELTHGHVHGPGGHHHH
jgi:FKBP-type peptidyl-prolyl cis-trans isomerase SlyD